MHIAKQLRNIQYTRRWITSVLGIYGGNKSVLLHLIQLEYLKKYCDNIVSIEI